MVKIKLPKGLRKVLFPKKRLTSSSNSSSVSIKGNGGRSNKSGGGPAVAGGQYGNKLRVSSSSSPPSLPPSSPPKVVKSGREESGDQFQKFLRVVDTGEGSSADGSPVTVIATPLSDDRPATGGCVRVEEEEEEGRAKEVEEEYRPRGTSFGDESSLPMSEQASSPARSVSTLVNAGTLQRSNEDHGDDVDDKVGPCPIPPARIVAAPSPHSPPAIAIAAEIIYAKESDRRVVTPTSPISKMSAFDVVEPQAIQGAAVSASPPELATSPSSPKRSQFSLRGEEARARAVARQRRILSKASLRLDAILDTSLENIEEATGRQMTTDSPDEELAHQTMVPPNAIVAPAPSSTARLASLSKVREEGKGDSSMISTSKSPAHLARQVTTGQVPDKEDDEEDGEKNVNPLDASHSKPLQADGPQIIGSSKKNIHFFILLVCPTSRIFELIEISASDAPNNDSTISDILDLIPQKCTDERLLQKQYCGFVRPSDRVDLVDPRAKAFGNEVAHCKNYQEDPVREGGEEGVDEWPSLDTIHENDVLVAVLEGHSGYQMSKISKPILRNTKFRDMIRRRSRRGGGNGRGSRRGGRHGLGKEDDISTTSNRSIRSGRRRRGERRGKDESRRPIPVVNFLPGQIGPSHLDDSSVISGVSFGKSTRAKISSSLKEGPNDNREDNRYSSLCQKLEHLSKKLHAVDDEFLPGDDEFSTAGNLTVVALEDDDAVLTPEVVEDVPESGVDEAVPFPEANFKMTPCMVASEITANIEDIFADHDVQIVAIDAEDDDSDDDTFATARSRRSARSTRSMVGVFEVAPSSRTTMDETPLLEITTRKRPPRRRPRPSRFESYEDDDMMLQIEAMARQADAAFESRKRTSSGGRAVAGTTIIEPNIESAIVKSKIQDVKEKTCVENRIEPTPVVQNNDALDSTDREAKDETGDSKQKAHQALVSSDNDIDETLNKALGAIKSMTDVVQKKDAEEAANSETKPETLDNKKKVQKASVSFDDEIDVSPNEVSGPMNSMTDGEVSPGGTSYSVEDALSIRTGSGPRDALSRNFLNASTSMVSTMVSASHGRVNEVHVLQYLGVTIVCIAANLLQQQVGSGQGPRDFTSPGGGSNPFRAKEVFQSAMFLAFMVNGQRYLAKVTEK